VHVSGVIVEAAFAERKRLMVDQPAAATESKVPALLNDFSLEMTGKDVAALEEAAPLIPAGTRISITFLGNEDLQMRVAAAAAVRRLGYVPVPHISARRLESKAQLEEFLEALAGEAAPQHVFLIGGDPSEPMGPFEDSLSLVQTGLLGQYGIRHVGFGGYPEGHPDIVDATLWQALLDKQSAAAGRGLETSIITQFGFDADPVFTWLSGLRDRGVQVPVSVGVPGPAGVKRLLGYARRFGVGTSAGIVHKYGFSLTNLLGTAGPDQLIRELATRHDPSRHGRMLLHFYTFGGLKSTAEWIGNFNRRYNS
jgi:methylenetetrahydrofolate reductase (NADPH)